ncbi:sigma-70 family RNA polymerase sigma factor [Candidatus Hydrogenedentota bacterium]
MMNDAEIVSRIIGGEERLFGELVRRYAGCVWAVCSSYISNPSDREEVAQDIFVKCYLRLHTLRHPRAFGRWLTQLSRRHCLNWLRSVARKTSAIDKYQEYVKVERSRETGNVEEGMLRDEVIEALFKLVNTLPTKTREALLLCYSEGYSPAQAAELLGIAPGALKRRLQYGRKLLHDRIEGELESALATRRHREEFTGKLLTAIPFGTASWLTETGTGAALVSKAGLFGGIALMSKKVLMTVGAVLFVAGLILLTRADKQEGLQIITREEGIVSRPADMVQDKNPSVTETGPETASSPEPASPPPPVPEEEPVAVENVAVIQEQVNEELPGMCTVSGSVVDENGNTVAGATVTVIATGVSSEKDDWNAKYKEHSAFYDRSHHSHGTSGPAGKYAIEGITVAGKAIVQAVASDLKGEVTVTLSTGEYCRNVLITVSESIILKGRVSTERGVVVGDAVVKDLVLMEPQKRSTGQQGQPLSLAYTDEQGYFELLVHAKGSATIAVMSRTHGFRTFSHVPVDGQQIAELILTESATIRGRVTCRSRGSVEGSVVALQGSALAGIILEGLGGYGTGVEGALRLVSLNREGEYCFDNVDPGQWYYIQVHGEDGASVSPYVHLGKVQAGETKIWDYEIQEDIVITGYVRGMTSGQPLKDIRVYCKKAGKPPEGGTTVFADVEDDGSYELRLPSGAGEYTLTPRFTLKLLPEYATRLSLQPGDEKEVDFALIEPVTILLRIVDEDGSGIAGAKVRLGLRQRGSRGAASILKQTDEDGYFQWAGFCPEVEYELRLSHPGHSPILLGPFVAGPDETFDEEVVLHRSAVITGVALDEQENPLTDRGFYAFVYDEGGVLTYPGTAVTDSDGLFIIRDAVGGTIGRLELTTTVNRGHLRLQWSSGSRYWPADQIVDLGEIVLQPKEEEPPSGRPLVPVRRKGR